MESVLHEVQERSIPLTPEEFHFLTLAEKYQVLVSDSRRNQFVEDCTRYDKNFLETAARKFSFRTEVIDFVVANPNTSVAFLIELLQKDNEIAMLSIANVQHIAAYHAFRNPKIGDALIDNYQQYVFEPLLAHESPLPETFERLFVEYRKDCEDYVNTLLFQHAKCPREIRMKLMLYCQLHVAYALQGNIKEMQHIQRHQYKKLVVEWVSSMRNAFRYIHSDLLFVLLSIDLLDDPHILKKCMDHEKAIIRRLARAKIKNLQCKGLALDVVIPVSFSDKIRDFFSRAISLLA